MKPATDIVNGEHFEYRLTQAHIHLDRLTHNLGVLRNIAGRTPMWPVIKADAYGHGAEQVARHLVGCGYDTLGVADVAEAAVIVKAGIDARLIVLSATLPEHSEALVAYGCEPTVCDMAVAEALAAEAERAGRTIAVHVNVDTGMGRIGIRPPDVVPFLEACERFRTLRIRGLMSHFPCADEADKSFSIQQIAEFREVMSATREFGIEVYHLANSAAIFDLEDSHLDAVRPGIAIYGLPPSAAIANPRVRELRPVLEWKTRIVFLKHVPAGVGLSYGRAYFTERPSLIATVPVGYGDGLSRRLSNGIEMLVRGRRCPQVGRITMDMSLVDVTALRGRVRTGDEVVIIGTQGDETVAADELAARLGTINYEIVTRIGQRVPRVYLGAPSDA